MSTAIYLIAILLVVMYMVSTIRVNPSTVKLSVVKAGKANEYFPAEYIDKRGFPRVVYANGKKIETSEYEKFYVHGNSMINYKIHDGERVLVKKIDDKESIQDNPVLMLTITDVKGDDAKFKLRKFISYFDYNGNNNLGFGELFDQNSKRLETSGITKEQFIESCSEKINSSLIQSAIKKGKTRLVFSETYNETKKINEFSLHPVDTIYGKVVYAI